MMTAKSIASLEKVRKEEVDQAIRKRRTKQIFTWWVLALVVFGGWFYLPLGYFLPICMFVAMGIGIYKGRDFCDWICPRGSTWDLLVKGISPQKVVPQFFRSLPWRLLWIGILMTVMGIGIVKAWPDYNQIGLVFVRLVTITTIIGLVLALFYHHRIWCMFCPVGTMANWIGRGKMPLMIDEKCKGCEYCFDICPLQIRHSSYKPVAGQAVVRDWDCLKCELCIKNCPEKALSFAA